MKRRTRNEPPNNMAYIDSCFLSLVFSVFGLFFTYLYSQRQTNMQQNSNRQEYTAMLPRNGISNNAAGKETISNRASMQKNPIAYACPLYIHPLCGKSPTTQGNPSKIGIITSRRRTARACKHRSISLLMWYKPQLIQVSSYQPYAPHRPLSQILHSLSFPYLLQRQRHPSP